MYGENWAPVNERPGAASVDVRSWTTSAEVRRFPDGKPMVDAQGRSASPKSRAAAVLLAWFIGCLGAHRFYVGKPGTGILMIVATVLTLGIAGVVWSLIDVITILVGSFRDNEGRFLSNW